MLAHYKPPGIYLYQILFAQCDTGRCFQLLKTNDCKL